MKKFLLLIAATAFALLTTACTDSSGYTYETVKNDPLKTRIYTLDNGLKVYMSVNKAEPRIETYIAVKVGGKNDPSETTGLAHYFEHLMFKGTQQFGTSNYEAEKPLLDQIEQLFEVYRKTTDDAERAAIYRQIDSISYEASKYAIPNEYDKLMSAIGALETNANTSMDRTVYIENIPSNQIENWARIQADRFKNVVIRGFHTELETIYEEKNMSLTDDNRKVYTTIGEVLYPNHPYGKQSVLGTQEHLKNPSITNVKNYHTQYYVPNNMAILLSGDFDPDQMIATIDKYFGDMQPNENIPQLAFEPEAPITKPIVKEVYGPDAANVTLAWRTDNAASDDAEYLLLASRILYNGQAGMIDLDLMQQQKVLDAFSYPDQRADYGALVLQGLPKAGQTLDEVRDLLLAEVAKLRNGEFSEELIKAVVNNLKVSTMREEETNVGRVEMYLSSFYNDIPWSDEVTKLDRITFASKEEEQAENLRKMFLAIANDVRVVVIKLADRLHNMRTLGYCSKEKRVRKARETMDVYAPLADRFGMGAIKVELEDLSFSYLMPEECRRLQSLIEPKQEERMGLLKKAMHKLEIALKDAGIKAEVSGRRKHIYSIYRKLNIKKVGLNEIYDLVALRIIVDTVQDCYGALGIVHSLWRPFPGRFKDYISMPKTNMYRSLHTTLFSDLGMPFEVQIRTWEMHRTAEYGIAAHWMYKEGRTRQDELDTKLAWLRQLVDYDSDANSTKEYVDNVRHDFFSDYVFVLTPNGEIIDLPLGSTPVDFAYRIHSNVGNHTQHAKVNGALVKLDCKLKTHDVVEIITNPQATPSRDWLNFVKTSQAKAKIKQWFKKANREENIVRGKEMLADAARRQGQKLADLTKAELCKPLLKRFSMNEMDDIYAAIGYGGITTGQALHKLMEARRKVQREEELARKLEEQEHSPAKSFDANGRAVIVKGEANMVVRFAQCCSPLPGDEIFGYITRGRGVSIHSRNCPNAAALLADADRIIDVSWADGESAKFPVTIHIVASERVGLLMDISQMLMNMKININLVNAKPVEDGTKIEATMGFQVQNAEHLDSIIKNLMKINGVKSVSRVRSV